MKRLHHTGLNPVVPGHYVKPKMFGKVEIFKDMPDGSKVVYLRRWYLIRIPRLFSIRIHHILQPDTDRDPHDHPWPFLSILLKGSYVEKWATREDYLIGLLESINKMRKEMVYQNYATNWNGWTRTIKRINVHTTKHIHQIIRFKKPGGVWTLFLTGREGRQWGFQTPDGWIPWPEYIESGRTLGADPGEC